jgi:hypothetical protein
MPDPNFEIGFAGPSLDNPVLFGRYADSLAAQLRQRYGPTNGYRISVEKEDKDPKKRKWIVNLFGGWFSGAKVTIKPVEATPHRAVVTVAWNSRVLEWLIKGIAVLSLLVFIPTFLIFAMATRLGFALLLTIVMFFIWALIASLIATALARFVALLFGNEFDADRRASLLGEIKSVPLPSPPEPRT